MKFSQASSWILLIHLLFAAAGARASDTLKIRSDLWCPYTCEPGERPGAIVEIAKDILEKNGHSLDYQLVNWPRAVAGTREGVYDAVVGAAIVDAPDFVFPKEAQAAVYYEFFTLRTKNWKYSGALDNVKVGVINSYNYDETVNKWLLAKDPHFVVISGQDAQEQRARMLMAGRIDAIYESGAVLKDLFSKLKLDLNSYQSAGAPPQPAQLNFIAFSPKNKKSKQLAAEIDSGMKQLRRSGELKKILDKYGLKDWK